MILNTSLEFILRNAIQYILIPDTSENRCSLIGIKNHNVPDLGNKMGGSTLQLVF